MKLLLAAATAATAATAAIAFPAAAAAPEDGRSEASSSDRRHCTHVTVRAGSRMSGRRVCRTASEWRETLGPDWRQHLAGNRGVEEDFEAVAVRASPFDGSAGQQGRSSRGGPR